MSINSSDHALNQAIIRLEDVRLEYQLDNKWISTFKEYMIHLLEDRVKQRKFNAVDEGSNPLNSGNIFGLIGRYSAGKCTLLKLVARILRLTYGRVVISGHIFQAQRMKVETDGSPMINFHDGIHIIPLM